MARKRALSHSASPAAEPSPSKRTRKTKAKAKESTPEPSSPEASAPVVTNPGLDLAKESFSLVNPVPATAEAWQAYTKNRNSIKSVKGCRDIFDPPEGDADAKADDDDPEEMGARKLMRCMRATLAVLEKEMGLEDKSLQDCVKILSCWVNLEECEESADIRDTDVISRIYSPSTPAYIDLHFTYHYRQRAFAGNNEWHYAVGYKLHSSPSGNLPDPAALEKEVPPSGMAPKKMHQQHGWEPLCFGESKSSGVPPKKEDVAGLYEILFGPLPEPPKRSSEALKVEQKRRLVRTIRVLLAAVGIDYRIAVEKGEKDVPPGRKGDGIHWKLDAKSDKQFAKRARKACGFQLPTK